MASVAEIAGEERVLRQLPDQDLALLGAFGLHVEAGRDGVLRRPLLCGLGVAAKPQSCKAAASSVHRHHAHGKSLRC